MKVRGRMLSLEKVAGVRQLLGAGLSARQVAVRTGVTLSDDVTLGKGGTIHAWWPPFGVPYSRVVR